MIPVLPTGPRPMELPSELLQGLKKELLPRYYNQGYQKHGGMKPWRVIASFDAFMINWRIIKPPFERRFNAEFKGPIIPFGAQIEYTPSRDTDIQRLHPFGKKC